MEMDVDLDFPAMCARVRRMGRDLVVREDGRWCLTDANGVELIDFDRAGALACFVERWESEYAEGDFQE